MVYTISVYVIINKIISFICCKIIIISYIGSIIRLNVNSASYFCIIKWRFENILNIRSVVFMVRKLSMKHNLTEYIYG
ncbi:hypothetical protein DUB87_10470 [Salmonella enterica subsp. houtenae serovar Houten]|nr:hypothetical protein [Salmonella enterica subsp. houtenae]EBJ4783244.1 hypothetical protein [Salmonella enterica]EBS0299261.1 hypothetical protein [Salmonella enterica subsp. houtenae serovar Houten]